MKNLEEIKAILGQVKSLVKDILIDYTEPPSLLDLVDLEYYLSDLLKVKADVISKNGLKGRRRERILSEVIYV